MPTFDKIFYMFVFNFYATAILIVLFVIFQNNIIASVRAIGIQCNVDYTIELPDPVIEDIK